MWNQTTSHNIINNKYCGTEYRRLAFPPWLPGITNKFSGRKIKSTQHYTFWKDSKGKGYLPMKKEGHPLLPSHAIHVPLYCLLCKIIRMLQGENHPATPKHGHIHLVGNLTIIDWSLSAVFALYNFLYTSTWETVKQFGNCHNPNSTT